MTEKIRLEVINLCKTVFDDEEFNVALNHLQQNEFHRLRLLIDEKCELLSIIADYTYDYADTILLGHCQKLESLVLDVIITAH